MRTKKEVFRAFVDNVLSWERVPRFEELEEFHLNLTRKEMEDTQAALEEFDPALARIYSGQVAALRILYESAAKIHSHLRNKTENRS